MPAPHIKIHHGHVIPFGLRAIVVAVFGVMVLVLFGAPLNWIGYIFTLTIMAFCFMTFSARYVMEFNMDDMTCFRYAWVLGLKLGGSRKFNYVEKLFVNKVLLAITTNKYSYNPADIERTYRNTVYKCFLKFDDGEKIFFDSDNDKEKLFNRLKQYNRHLKTSIYDTTSPHEPILVESVGE